MAEYDTKSQCVILFGVTVANITSKVFDNISVQWNALIKNAKRVINVVNFSIMFHNRKRCI